MTASIARVGQVLGVSQRAAWLIAVCGLVCVASAAALATRQGMLTILFGLAVFGVVTMLGLRWPILPLTLFAALIPLEQVVAIDGLGTISRFAGILFAVTYALPRLGHLVFRAMPPAAWAYLAWVVVSVGWALDPGTAGGQFVTLLQLFVIAFFVADFVVHQPTMVRSILWAYSLSATATALIGLQLFVTQGSRAAAFEGQNPEHFAAVLTPALLFGLHAALSGDRRILGVAIALVTTIAVIVTGTRAAWVAIVVVLLLFMLPQVSPKRRIALAGLALALAAVAYQIPGVAEMIGDRASTAISSGGAGRTDIWSVAGTIYQSSPVLGVGFANFPVAYTPQMLRASGAASWLYTEGRAAHNFAIMTIVELGPIGLLLLAAFLGPLVLRRGWGPEALTVQAVLAALLVQALFVDMLYSRKPLWLFIGFAAGIVFLARRDQTVVDIGLQDATPAGATPATTTMRTGPHAGPRVALPS